VAWRSRSKKTPALLLTIINDKNTEAKEGGGYMRSFHFIQGPENDAALVELLTGGAARWPFIGLRWPEFDRSPPVRPSKVTGENSLCSWWKSR
jgi:hypothetical protein